jgi:hypothetical protein
MISASTYRLSLHTASTALIYSMPNHDFVAVSSKCVVSSIWCAIFPMISLAATFNCSIGSVFSNSSILALYSTSTVSILTTSACECTTTFYTFSNTKTSGSSCMSGSSENNSTTTLFMLTSSYFLYAANIVTLWYLFSILSRSFLSATFSALTSCSLSLNSSVICACKILNVSEGSGTKSSCAAPSCSPSCALGQHMLIGVTETNLCQVPSESITVLCIVDGVATCGVWPTSVFNSVSCVSIVSLSTSYAVVIVMIDSDILSQNLSAMLLKSSSCSTA